jgi:dynein heavy chain 2
MANSSKKLAQFLIDLYSNVREKFSVDDHRHYLFTPRDLTGLVFNLLRYEINEAQGLIETLIYESSRIFRDRLVDKDSKIRFDKILYSLLKNHLRYNEQMKATYFISKIAQGSQGLVPGLPLLGRIGAKDFEAMIDQTLRAYEREYKAMDVHLIEEILDLVAYTERTLSQPGANLLLAGRSGTGRKQSAQLVAHLLNMEFFTPSISRDYSMKEFKRDLKEVLLKAGVEATRTCLFIEDHQLLQDEFLEYLNSLISAGEVPGLYSPEELEPVLAQLKDEMSSQYEYKTTFELFVSRIKKNLSIVMSLDYSHPKFVQNCASNPALFSQCNVIWCEGWTKEALHTVARNELADISSEIGKAFDQVIASILILHNSSQSLGASPLAFMNLIHLFK